MWFNPMGSLHKWASFEPALTLPPTGDLVQGATEILIDKTVSDFRVAICRRCCFEPEIRLSASEPS